MHNFQSYFQNIRSEHAPTPTPLDRLFSKRACKRVHFLSKSKKFTFSLKSMRKGQYWYNLVKVQKHETYRFNDDKEKRILFPSFGNENRFCVFGFQFGVNIFLGVPFHQQNA